MLKINNLYINSGEKEIIKNLSFEINDGEVHAIMGPNGAGKSTIGKALMSSPEYQKKGEIYFCGENITHLSTDKIAMKKIYLINQMPPAIEGVTNFDLLKSAVKKFDENFSLLEFNKQLEEVLKEVNLPSSYIFREVNSGFSGGERKKNELMHLWMLKPKFIILDEVDSGLDVDALKIVIESLKKYIKTYKPGVLIITHRIDILKEFNPDKVHVLKSGELIKSGNEEIINLIDKSGFTWTNEVTV